MAKRLYILLHSENDGNSLTLPLNPEDIDISTEKDIGEYNILNYGEVPVVKYGKLKRIELSSLLPDDTSYFALLTSLIEKLDYKPYTKQKSVKMIEDWVENGKPVRLVIAGDAYEEINAEFLIEKFNKNLRESTPDIKGGISLIEYKNPAEQAKTFETPRGKLVKLITRPIRKFIPQNMTMQQGATLYKIAKKVYGEASAKSDELAKLNGIFDRNKDLGGMIIDMLPLSKVNNL